jgi:hypothetical protein
LKVASGAVLAALVAGSLMVGARAAFAHPVMMHCPYNSPGWLGACTSQEQCNTDCVVNWGGYQGQCTGGCCRCFL